MLRTPVNPLVERLLIAGATNDVVDQFLLLPDELKVVFLDDFEFARSVFWDDFNVLEDGVMAWEKLFHNSIDDAIRINTTYLSAVSKQITNYGDDVLYKFERVVPNVSPSKLDDYFAEIDDPKSIYQLKALVGDFENIPGVKVDQFSTVANGLSEMASDLVRSVDGKIFTLKRYQPTTFVANANLPARAGVELIEDLENGIELVKVTSGTKLYRVFDGFQPDVNTSPKGAYWTFEKPNIIDDVIGDTAVQPDWNGMVKIIEIEAPPQGLVVWRGNASRQPLSSKYNVTDRYLDGGTDQVIFDIDTNQISLPDITNSIQLAPWTN